MIKRLLIAVLLLVILLLGAVFILPGLVPTDTYRDKLEAELSKTLARDVDISGDIKISTFPVVKIQTGPVTLSNPVGFSENNFIDVQGMEAKVKLWPLLRKVVEISGVTLDSPTIRLEKQANGDINWSLNETGDTEQNSGESTPYKRDGRYTEYDPSLALLRITDGQLIYSDAVSEQNVTVEKVNLDLRAPSLRDSLKLEGDLTIDGLATRLSASLQSPLDFLSGLETPFRAQIDTDEGSLETSGTFKASENIAFDANFNASSNDPLALAARLPLPEDLKPPPLTKLTAKGDLSYTPNSIRLTKVDFAAQGQSLDITYIGDVNRNEELTADGQFTARLDDMSVLDAYLKEPVSLPLTKLTAKGGLSYNPNSIRLPKLEFAAEGPGLDITYIGDVNRNEELTADGQFTARLDDMSVLDKYLEEPVAALDAVSAVEANGTLNWDGTRLDISALKSRLTGPQLEADYQGTARFDDELMLEGSFSGETSDLTQLAASAGLSQPDAAALKRVAAKGTLDLKGEQIMLSNLSATAKDGFVNGDFDGQIILGESLKVDGRFSGEIPDLGALDSALARDIPYAEVTKRIEVSTQIETTASGFTFSDVTAGLKDGLLKGDFTGRLAIGDNSDISGTLDLNAASLRALAKSQNINMPPSTQVGAIFEPFTLSGQVSGTPELINFNSGTLALDAISGTGDFALNMTGAKPRLTGVLAFNPLDLRPYMAAWSEQKPEGIILPWSTAPINLQGLDAVSAEIDITTPSVKMDRMEFGETAGRARLENAILSTEITKAQLYDGLMDGSLAISAANGVPRISINADISSVAAQTFLSASSGFDKVAGTATLSLSLEGQGLTQDAIMKSLSGTGEFKILSGQLLGIDAGELISGLDQVLSNKQLPQGLGLGKTTDFNDLTGSFSITNGRANIGSFKLQSGGLFMDAEGFIDIGGQRLDFGIRPKLSDGSDLAKFGVPLKFSGAFGEAKAGLDTEMLGEIAKAKARQTAGDAIRDRVSGPLGDILGGVIGGGAGSDTSAPASEETAPSETETPVSIEVPTPETPSETTNEAVTEPVIPEVKPAEEPPAPEEQIENALKDIFGRIKKKPKSE